MGNPISADLAEATDLLLKDITQMTDRITYTDIMYASQRLTVSEIATLDIIAKEVYSENECIASDAANKYFNFNKNGQYSSIKDKIFETILTKLNNCKSALEELTEEFRKLDIFFSKVSGVITFMLPDKHIYKLEVFDNPNYGHNIICVKSK